MPLFRRPFDRRSALARPVAPHDASVIASLGYHAFRRYLTSSIEDVVDRVPHEPTAVLEYEGRIVAMAQAGWRMPPNAWLRALLIDSRVDATSALPLLIDQLHRLLPARAVSALYITLDEWSAPWLRGPLEKIGYRRVMDVVTYEKVGMEVPSSGNQVVIVRQARPDDLQAVLDAICFPTPWGKGEEILGPALISAPYFSVAEFSGDVIGYTYVTVHQAGLHAHLVRIAVSPAFQGHAIGVRLLADVVRFCRHRRIDLLTLNTQDYNIQAQRLYEWFGFQRTGEIQAVLGIEGLGQRSALS
jgi:[ribosomal protein S18]-alanine N-acetyltransferase